MAELHSEQYSSVFSPPKYTDEEITRLLADDSLESELSDVLFNELDIIEAIESIPSNSAASPDGFPAVLLKQCRHSLSLPLYLISRRSLDDGNIPQVCKTGNIVPIDTGDSRGSAKNYRPVALTSHLVKVFEKVMKKALIRFIEDNGLFNPRASSDSELVDLV